MQIYYLCKQHNYVLPSVYQGLYNPLARQVEVELLPALKTLGIAFYVRDSFSGTAWLFALGGWRA